MKREENLQNFLLLDLLIHFANFIRMWKEFILGGHIVLVQERRMQGGGLIIS